MPLYPAADLAELALFVNAAYRGDSSRRGWTTEADYIGGQRTDEASLREEIEAKPEAMLLTLRDASDAPLLGCVWLEPEEPGVWYLGMFTVSPELQNRGLGRTLLALSEAAVRERGATHMRLGVLNVRDELIGWYQRRGYAPSGETRPFPYGDDSFGLPVREGFYFVMLEKRL